MRSSSGPAKQTLVIWLQGRAMLRSFSPSGENLLTQPPPKWPIHRWPVLSQVMPSG